MTINHYTGLTLDAEPNGYPKQIKPSGNPLFNFRTNDIDVAYEYGYKIESAISRFDHFVFFTVSDPDKKFYYDLYRLMILFRESDFLNQTFLNMR